MYKTKNSFSCITMKQIFPDMNYNGPNIRSQIDFELPHVNSVKGQDTAFSGTQNMEYNS